LLGKFILLMGCNGSSSAYLCGIEALRALLLLTYLLIGCKWKPPFFPF